MPLGYFTDSTPLTPLRDPFNVLVDAVNANETSITNLGQSRAIQTFRWADATERAAQTGMQAGDMGYQVDTGAQYQYTGTVWIGVGALPLQTKSGTSVASISLDPIPNASMYSYFRFVVNITTRSASAKIGMRLRAGGADNASAVYDYYATTPVTSTQWADLGAAAAGPCSIQGTIYDLSKASPTRIISQSTGAALSDGTGINITNLGGQHRATTAFDSFTILAASGTFTGAVSVWGVQV